ncbi:MAG: hypothetical protein QF535_05275 [Anaerolineales bacterium]|nr:hypothetical protein [Anaerolineales bacterium]
MAQTVTAYVNTATNGKIFSVSADESSWENPMVDSLGSNDLGQVMAGSTITNVSVVYTSGSAIARIQDRNTLQVKRTFTASKAGTTDFSQTKCAPYRVQPNDILVCYAQAADATANQSSCLAWLTVGNQKIAFGGTDIVDATATEILSLVNSNSLGTYYNQNLRGIEVMLEDGAALSLVTIINPDGGTAISIPATTRDAGHYYFNLQATGLNIPIQKGTQIKIACVTSS